jgi:hypothetical protein
MSQEKYFVKINDFQQVITKTYNYIDIQVKNVVLRTSVEIQVFFYDINQNLGDIKTLNFTGTDYTNWGNDDTYIVNMVCQKLGLTLANTTIMTS